VGITGKTYAGAGYTFETQHFPNSPTSPFPDTVLGPQKTFRSTRSSRSQP